MHRDHAELLAEIRRVGREPARADRNDSYGGSGHIYYFVRAPVRREIAKNWLARNKSMPATEFLAVVRSLVEGESHEEKTLAAILLGYHPNARRQAGPLDVDRWLGYLNGWAEIDALCYNVFSADELLTDWPEWKSLIRRLANAPEENKRRAALVLLTRPVHTSQDIRLRDLAFDTINVLRAERDPLITKAVSWLLRSMVTHHRDTTTRYLQVNEGALPAVAVRETRTKLATGTKRGRALTAE